MSHMSEKDIKEKNKEMVQRLVESQKKSEESVNLKPTVKGRIWFFLTCLRPATKLELARTAQVIVQNRRLVNQMVFQMNNMTLKISEIVGYLHGRGDSNLSKSMGDTPVKKLKERKENNIMYR